MKQWFKRLSGAVLAVVVVLAISAPTPQTFAAQSDQSALLSPADKILNIAHRGASGHAPEHTLAAYEKAVQMKADYIEIDLQMTKDGVLVAMHDETLDRTTNGTGYVKDHTLAEIKRLDAGSWFNRKHPDKANPTYVGLQVPTLEEILQTFGPEGHYYIETKEPGLYPGMEEELLRILAKYKLTGQDGRPPDVIIQSFSPHSLQKIHRLNPAIPLIQLMWYDPATPGKATITDAELNRIKQYAVGVGPNYRKIDQAYVVKVRRHGLLIHPYTVDDAKDMKRLLDWGVTGLFTGYPDVLRDVLKSGKV
ncbi:glycerophosphodiester phosphodiesterase [Effusibacillus pohliae]|uniref:glycerophosphodiester phosphodiesterase n=1 Tax=Effusibacillus pohliae TaxID=232270 RepID=UPI000380F3E7|nr:glycerophosphodiester phosphodiesterase [Effusibacillus pohliae]